MTKKVLSIFLGLLIAFFVGIIFSPRIKILLLDSGLISEEISIAGTGSMYPTFPKGEGSTEESRAQQTVALPKMKRFPGGVTLLGTKFFSTELSRGDVVQFENDLVHKLSLEKYGEEAGFVKRIIAIAGDDIELRDGFVKVNGSALDEPYIAKPRSTYGGDFLEDCRILHIPEGKVFVMGDNRKASLDSRYELGLIDIADIHHILPVGEQEGYKTFWRDTTKDATLAHSSTLDVNQFVNLLNNQRSQNKIPPLKLNKLLSQSGSIRGKAMIESDDFSTEATRSGMTLEKSLHESGYQNIVFAELYTKGYYEADELFENFLEFPDTKKILLSREYQDIGIAAQLGEIKGCPTQVIVTHFGGYVPPNYKQSDIDSWQKLITNLEDVYKSWKQLQNADNIDRSKLNQLLYLFETRMSNAKQILARMKSNEWLTSEEKNLVKKDKEIGDEMQQLITQLNKH